MKCPQCGQDNFHWARRCDQCGHSLVQPATLAQAENAAGLRGERQFAPVAEEGAEIKKAVVTSDQEGGVIEYWGALGGNSRVAM